MSEWRVGMEWWLEGVLYRELLDPDGAIAGYVDPAMADSIAASLNR